MPYESGFDAGDAQRSAQLLRNENASELYYRIDGKFSTTQFCVHTQNNNGDDPK